MIILIAGRKRSGKDYVADKLRYNLQSKFNIKIKAFAHKLKEIVANSLSISLPELEIYKNREELVLVRESAEINGHSIYNDKIITNFRKILQNLGDSLRNIDIDIFVKEIDKYYNENNQDILIVPDLRYINEYEYLKKDNNVFTILVEGGLEDGHQSEQLPKVDFEYIIDNKDKKDISNDIDNITKKNNQKIKGIICII